MTAVIVCNGRVENPAFYTEYLNRAQYIIGADGGASHLRRMGVKPHVLLGDFDSLPWEDLAYFRDLGVEIATFPREKDMTDSELAARFAVEKGFTSLLFIGVLGSRFDHSLSNIFMLKPLLDQGVQATIVDEYNEITLIRSHIRIAREEGAKLTLLPLSGTAEGVSTKGLYYPLHDATIEIGSSWGVSNEFASDWAEVSVAKGDLLVIKSRD